MELYKAICSGIVNGLVNLSPLSDGAHFEIFKTIIADNSEQIALLLAMSSFGSLVALLFYFRLEYRALFRKTGKNKLIKLLLLAAPLCVAYPALMWLIEKSPVIMNPFFAIVMMLVSSIVVLNFNQIFRKKEIKERSMSKKRALITGFVSCLSLLPGLSRIMVSIVAGRAQNIKEGKSLRYSILASAPFLLVVFIRALLMPGGTQFFTEQFGPILIANLVSFIITLFVIRFIMKREEEKIVRYAAWYQATLALFVLFFELVKI